MAEPSLYDRLGGNDAIALILEQLLPRLKEDNSLRPFWSYRTEDSVALEMDMMVEFI